ncbi:MAG TPA: MFS transporter, partial [candidate division Zixibacteria bacterium]
MEPDTPIEVNPRSGSYRKILTRDFVLCFFSQFAFTSVFHILIPTLPIYLSRLGSTEVEIGVLVGVIGVSSLIFRPLVGRALQRIPEKRFMILGAILMTLSSAAYLWVFSFWLFLIVRIVQGISLALFYTATITLVANISPEEHRGQTISYYYLAFNISFALSPSLGMLLINHFNFTVLFLACIGLSLCSLFIADKLGPRVMAPPKNRPPEEDSFFSR